MLAKRHSVNSLCLPGNISILFQLNDHHQGRRTVPKATSATGEWLMLGRASSVVMYQCLAVGEPVVGVDEDMGLGKGMLTLAVDNSDYEASIHWRKL